MKIIKKTADTVLLRFEKAEIPAFSDPIMKHAEDFASATLNMAYSLKQQAYRMSNDFSQPPHAFGE